MTHKKKGTRRIKRIKKESKVRRSPRRSLASTEKGQLPLKTHPNKILHLLIETSTRKKRRRRRQKILLSHLLNLKCHDLKNRKKVKASQLLRIRNKRKAVPRNNSCLINKLKL